jgi:hypothetical protein
MLDREVFQSVRRGQSKRHIPSKYTVYSLSTNPTDRGQTLHSGGYASERGWKYIFACSVSSYKPRCMSPGYIVLGTQILESRPRISQTLAKPSGTGRTEPGNSTTYQSNTGKAICISRRVKAVKLISTIAVQFHQGKLVIYAIRQSTEAVQVTYGVWRTQLVLTR